MRIGMIGLGRMGANMARRLVADGHEVLAYDRDARVTQGLAAEHSAIEGADSVAAVVHGLDRRRTVWLMLPAGPATSTAMAGLLEGLERGDAVVNGGNCRWTDSQGYARQAGQAGVAHLDVGVSGGVWGLAEGYCLMVGGDHVAYQRLEPILASLAPEGGYGHVGPAGAGHFAKMVHNGIEYAMLQSFAEGFDLLRNGPYDYDLGELSALWQNGSVVRSWMLDLVGRVYADHSQNLAEVAPHVEDSGEGRWTVEAGVEHAVPVPVISAALFARFASRRDSYGNRMIAALREPFGGHAVRRRDAA